MIVNFYFLHIDQDSHAAIYWERDDFLSIVLCVLFYSFVSHFVFGARYGILSLSH